ncbi:sirohydrochlorin chelatase [Streptomyces inhibens]|uniref:sirohydrochlorin chelatase n=1 Tax=Streptomyces inhibens TaxID=2293571 RepID=UPI00402A7F34
MDARPTLLVIAHGSRDPRHAATVSALCAKVRSLRPGLRVEVGYLDFNAPRVPRVLERLSGEVEGRRGGGPPGRSLGEPSSRGGGGRREGVREVVALPLLLTRAFHAKSDIPAVLREAAARLPLLTVRQSEVLGPSTLLTAALERRLEEAGLRPGDRRSTGVVLASAGSSDPEAIAVIAEIAREWRRTAGWCAVRPAFASASLPRTADAVRALRAEGVHRVAVAPYVIAPGFLPDRIAAGAREARADILAPVLGPAPELARLLLRRYDRSVMAGARGRAAALTA